MKTELRRLIFSALLLSGTSMTFAENGATTVVGDLPGYEKAETKTEAKAAKTQDAVRVGDLDSETSGPSTTVSDLETNYVSDSDTNRVSDLDFNIVGDVVPNFTTDSGSNSGTVVIGLAPSMVTDLPASTRSNFVEAVPLPILIEKTPSPAPQLPAPTSKSDDIAKPISPAKPEDKGTNSEADAKEGKQKQSDELQTVDVQPFKPIAFQSNKNKTVDCDCGQTCDGGCKSSSPSKRTSRLSGIFDRCPDRSWLSSEFLLWNMQDRNSPALVTTSPVGTFPILPDAEVVYGDKLKGEFSGGFRLDAGKYVTENLGVGGRFWILAENNDSFFRDVRPTQYWMGRPFYNASIGPLPLPPLPEDVLLVSGVNGGVLGAGDFEGSISANSAVNVWAAEAYTRLRLNCSSDCKFEFISGYSHFSLDDELSISSITFDTNTAQLWYFNDLFDTKNRFHGGQLGFEMSLSEGRWTFRSLTKVHLGNMNQRVMIAGNHATGTLGGLITTGSGGLLAMGNQGHYERNQFSFIPEANLKLEYCVRKNVALTLGYSFVYFDKLALAGAQVDRIIDPSTLALPAPPWPANPAFSFNDSSMWVQGIDFGLRMDF